MKNGEVWPMLRINPEWALEHIQKVSNNVDTFPMNVEKTML